MSRERPAARNTFGGPNTSPQYENNYNGEPYKSGSSTFNKKKRNRTRSKSRNRRRSQNNSIHNTSPNYQNKTPPNFQGAGNMSNRQNTTRISPAPKTICKDKSLPFDKYPFIVNENAGFYADIQYVCSEDKVEDSCDEDSAISNNSTVVRFGTATNSPNNNSKRTQTLGVAPKILKPTKDLKSSNINISKSNEPSCTAELKDSFTNVGDDAGKSFLVVKEPIHSDHVQDLMKSDINITDDHNIINRSAISGEKSTSRVESNCSESAKPKTSLKNKPHEQIHKNAEYVIQKTETSISGEVQKHEYLQQPTVIHQKTCKCEKCDDFIECTSWCNNNLLFAESQNLKRGLPFLKNSVMEKLPTITKTLDNKIILQGPIIPKPMFSLDETFMDETVQEALRKLDCTSAKDIQSYMWPAVQRGLSVFMVGPPKCGKTFAYLPAFCSFCTEKNDRYMELSKYEGPLIIILCSTAEDCYELQSCAKMLIASEDVTVEVLTDESSVQAKCDILIAIPSVLEHCLKKSMVIMKRLCHLAIEKGHLVLKNQFRSIQKIFKAMNILQTNRPHNKNIQVVVSSEKWSPDLETLLKRLYTTPVVCFEDFLEAAVYSRVQFAKKQTKTKYKLFQLSDLIKKYYSTQKTVVFCNEEEILKLKDQLETSGVECIVICNNLIEDEIFENEDTWNSLRSGQLKVLLCTDSVFEKTVNVLSAQWLVHYHLPTEWLEYKKRFRCLSANITSPFDPEETPIYEFQSKCSFIIMDEFYDDKLFLDFFEILTRNCTQYLQL